MEKGLTQLDYDHIDLILQEAEQSGVKELVELWATMYMAHPDTTNLLKAYQMAYSTITQNKKL